MMIGIPLLLALIPGVILLFLTWLFSRMQWSLTARILPSITVAMGALVLFYIGYVEVRGFEGATYSLLSIFLFLFAAATFVIAKKPLR
ncbi:hypothetical protein CHN50_02945 [Priestia aryabhattai]|uniref:YesK family protein n=1 Tax=Priestia TaxID=2800373 RepID=UPI000BA0B081|nr:YesK family protein [Priestia flexa]MDT2046857.1 YesK family protein [Priestia flexa]MEC0667326.1 YesK family protein [Priestia flexa]OZT14537.1 hypothetical protein CHN50_02945 [Priestia aryabhattai]